MSKTSNLCILLATLLFLTGCNQSKKPQNDSTATVGSSANVGSILGSDVIGSASYDATAEHGEKAVYGYASESNVFDRRESLNSWGNYYFQWDLAWLLCYDKADNSVPVVSCFDSLCSHQVDTCPVFYQFDRYEYRDPVTEQKFQKAYPYYIFCDYYDNANSPVFYSVYRRNSVGHIGSEAMNQEPYYLIQRYDLSSGQRITLCSGIQDLVQSAYTYGDYLYFVTSEDYNASNHGVYVEGTPFTLNVIPKTGGQPKSLANANTLSLNILDITDDGVYYLVNSRYIYHCTPTLEKPEMILDIDSIIDGNGNHVRLAAVRDGYFFYFGDLVLNNSEFSELYEADGSCYRAPLNDPTNTAKIAEHMICSTSYLLFTENYLYYMPTVMKDLGIRTYNENGQEKTYYAFNHSDGVVKAVQLFTGETTTACNIPGISFMTGYAIDSDSITVYGQAYDAAGLELGTGLKQIRLYPDERSYEYWFDLLTQGINFVIPG